MMPIVVPLTLSQQIDLNSTTIPESQYVVPCAGYTIGSVQATLTTGTWGTAVVTIRKSNDGKKWIDYGATITDPEMTDLSVARFAFLGFFVTTAEGSAATAQLTIHLKSIEAIPA